jgi:hypothetical protein
MTVKKMIGLVALASSGVSALQRPSSVPDLKVRELPDLAHPIAQSLVFDQSFDSESVRPLPKILLTNGQEPGTRELISRAAQKQRRPILANLENSSQQMPAVRGDLEADLANFIEKAKAAALRAEELERVAAEAAAKVEAAAALAAIEASIQAAKATAPKPLAAPPGEVVNLDVPVAEVAKAPVVAIQEKEEPTKAQLQKSISLASKRASVTVIDEESLLAGETAVIPGASIHWIHENSGLVAKTDAKGRAVAPYPRTLSVRFIAKAPGYLPATGYAIEGLNVPVSLVRESRLGPIIKTLGIVPDREKVMLWGKAIGRDFRPIEHLNLDLTLDTALKAFYSVGSFGLFHPSATETGAQGDFIVAGLRPALQYLLPNQSLPEQETLEWPAQIIDLKGIGPIVTTTILEPQSARVTTQIVDSFTLERPDTGIFVTVGGQRGMRSPEADGVLDMNDVPLRNNVDLFEIRAQGYRKVWVSAPAIESAVPDMIALSTEDQMRQIFAPVSNEVDLDQGVVLGVLRPELYRKPIEVRVYDSVGRRLRQAKVWYFNEGTNSIDPNMLATASQTQTFAIGNLPEGEWHAVIVDPASGHGLSVQVFRTEDGTISQLQF